METDSAEPAQAPEAASEAQPVTPAGPHAQRYQRLRGILTGSTPIQLYLEFLYTHNHADLQILRNMKGAVEARNSVCHSAVIFANATMHSGTTVDAFLRENLDWLSRATNWAKFNATAGLGVIHRCFLTPHTQMNAIMTFNPEDKPDRAALATHACSCLSMPHQHVTPACHISMPHQHATTACCCITMYALLCAANMPSQHLFASGASSDTMQLLTFDAYAMQGAFVTRQGSDGAIPPQGWWLRKSIL